MNVMRWISQATTGAGFATVVAGLGAVASGSLTWQQAIPVLVGGATGLIWPENSGMKAISQRLVADVAALITAYQSESSASSDAAGPAASQAVRPQPATVPPNG